MAELPSAEVQAAAIAASGRVTRRVDIYDPDGSLWMENAPLAGGTVSVDGTRAERRSLELDLNNKDGSLDNYPDGFWYDKIIKPFRGFEYVMPNSSGRIGYWETQLGEFLIDSISTSHFPSTVHVTCRDYTKKLLEDKFASATTFVSGQAVEDVIRTIATNGGISKFNTVATGKFLGKDFIFEGGTERWQAITDIATAYGYEVFFDAAGYLELREFRDPVTAATIQTFETGQYGNLSNWTKASSDTRIYNHVVVTGESSDTAVPPVVAEATNTNPASPTSVANLGRRKTYRYTSSFITTLAQAQNVANKFLQVHALESFDLSLSALVIPWLEATEIIEFIDPSPNPGDPTRFLLSTFDIPLALGQMSVSGKRVTMVN